MALRKIALEGEACLSKVCRPVTDFNSRLHMILMGLGVIGYYIAKIYEEVKCRPRYIVSRKVGAGMTWEKRR